MLETLSLAWVPKDQIWGWNTVTHLSSVDFYLQWLYFHACYLKGYLCEWLFRWGQQRVPLLSPSSGDCRRRALIFSVMGFPPTLGFLCPVGMWTGIPSPSLLWFPCVSTCTAYHRHTDNPKCYMYDYDNLILSSILLLTSVSANCGWIDQTISGGKWLLWWD